MDRESSPEEGEILEEGELESDVTPRAEAPEQEPGELVEIVPSVPVTQNVARQAGKDGTSSIRGASQDAPGQDRKSSHAHASTSSRSSEHQNAIADSLCELTKRLSLKDAKRDTKQFCVDLDKGLRLLVQLSALVQNQQDPVGQQHLSLSKLASKVFDSLKALHIVSTLGTGKSVLAGKPEAVAVVQLAQKHLKLFSPHSQTEFQGWCSHSKVFAGLMQPLATPASCDAPQSVPPPTLPPPAGIRPLAPQSRQIEAANGLHSMDAQPAKLVHGVKGLAINKPKPPPGDPPNANSAPSRPPPPTPAATSGLPRPIVLRPPGEPPSTNAIQFQKELKGGGVTSAAGQVLPTPTLAPLPRPVPHSTVRPAPLRTSILSAQQLVPSAVPKPAPPKGPKPPPPTGPPPPGKTTTQNGAKSKVGRPVPKPRPPPGSPPKGSRSKENLVASKASKLEKLPPGLSLKLAAYRKSFLLQQKQLKAAQQAQTEQGAQVKGSEASEAGAAPSYDKYSKGSPSKAQRSASLSGSGVPGLDVDTPRASQTQAAAKKRPRPMDEDIISLEDEIDLYSFGPSPASLAAASEGAELLANELSSMDNIPGIDLPSGAQKRAKLDSDDERTAPEAEEQYDELDEEEDRLFGDASESEEEGSEDEGASDANTDASVPGSLPEVAALPDAGGTIELQSARLAANAATGSIPETALEEHSPAVTEHLSKGKLCLVLDLDHTLLNSARWGEMGQAHASTLENFLERQETLSFGEMQLHSIEGIQMWTKLRPSCRAFLKAMSQKFTMWIHTNGNKHYAAAISALLDPTKEYFGDRIVANAGFDPTEGATAVHLIKRLDAQGLEGLEPITVIVDDSASVWPGHGANLVQVERYCYFPNSTRQFGYTRVSLLESGRDESPEQGMLSVVQRVLLRTHEEVMSRLPKANEEEQNASAMPGWDVRLVLSHFRSQILKGTKVIFSRLWQVGQKSEEQPLWRLASQLGADCTTKLDTTVTHLVTDTRLTEKAQWAMKHGKAVVNVRWLEASSILWTRAQENSFPVLN